MFADVSWPTGRARNKVEKGSKGVERRSQSALAEHCRAKAGLLPMQRRWRKWQDKRSKSLRRSPIGRPRSWEPSPALRSTTTP